MIGKLQQVQCDLEIDYSDIEIDGRILPFAIELDTDSSILEPVPGQNQRFCYHIEGIGEDDSDFIDLSHIVFGICPQLIQSQITNITVARDGETETVTFPGNVELKTPDNPDPPTGCPGLKFNFGLDKVAGIMDVCFELTTPLAIGPIQVCLFGGNRTANQLSICGPICQNLVETCDTTVSLPMRVCVPVTVTPFANAGVTTTYCCGDPVITPGPAACTGTQNGSCSFTITQNICVEVPIEIGANATVGDTFVQCCNASAEDICTNCGEIGATPLSNSRSSAGVRFTFR